MSARFCPNPIFILCVLGGSPNGRPPLFPSATSALCVRPFCLCRVSSQRLSYAHIILCILRIGIVGFVLDRVMSVVEARFKTT
jgi:hypothetical protein